MHSKPLMRLPRLFTIVAPVIIAMGCGEGDGQQRIPGTPVPLETGILLDAPVSGATWETSSGATGTTNNLGEFQYEPFESVTFSVGGIVLGTASGAPIITVVELTRSVTPDDQAARNQLVFFQSIDADQNPSNGITISDNTRSLAQGETLDFTLNAADFAAAVAKVVADITEPDNRVVSEQEALVNFYETYAEFGGTDAFSFLFPGFPPVGGGIAEELVFRDEFNEGASPDPEKWTLETGYGPNNSGWGNNEWQLYTESPDNIRVEDGNLVIQARCDTPPCGVRDGTITSGKINTLDKFNFRFGRIVARIKPPVGDGAWPAFWSLGANFPEVGWPRSGEIDFMEMHNAFSNERTTHFTMHWCDETLVAPLPVACFPDGWIFETRNREFPNSLGDDFHIFEADWNADRIVGKIDGIQYFELPIEAATMEEFLREFYMILNVAMGGTLGSDNQPPNGNEVWPQTMLVDYVRVFQRVGAGGPAEDLTIDFEDAPESYVFNNFEGGVTTVIANPVAEGINNSAQVARMQKFAADSGQLFGGSLLTLASPLVIENGVDGTMKVWSQRSVQVLLKLEGADGSDDIELEVTHGGTGWEELAYDFSSYSGTVEAVTLIFDNGVLGMAGTVPADWTFYYDDITLVQIIDTGSQIDLPITFDDATVDYTLTDFGDPVATMTTLVVDPENALNRVASTTKPVGTPQWAGVTMSTEAGLASPLPFTATATTIGMRVYSPAAGIPVRLKADNVVNGDVSVETELLTTVANQWETLVFDFANPVADTAALDLDTSYTALSVFFNFGTDGDTAGEQTFLWDDVVFGVPLPDVTPPTLTDVSIASSNAVNSALATLGDVVTVEFIADEPIETPVVTIAGVAVTATDDGVSWQAGRALTEADMDGPVAFSVAFTDLAGNAGVEVTTTTDASAVEVDATAPFVLAITGPLEPFTTLAPIGLTFQFNEPVSGFNVSDIMVTNGGVGSFMTVDAATYTANVTPNGIGNLEVAVVAGAVADAAGNLSLVAAGVSITNDLDADAPLLTVINIASDNATDTAYARTDDVVTISMTATEDIQLPVVTIAGEPADTVTMVGGLGSTWEATRTMLATDDEGEIAFTIDFVDLDDNPGPQSTVTTNGSSVTFDITAPTLSIDGLPDTPLANLDPIAVTFQFNEEVTGFEAGDIAVTNGSAAGFTTVDPDMGTYTADVTPDGGGDLTVAIAADAATDLAGNGNATASETALLPVWQLVFSDDFPGMALDTNNWTIRTDADCPDPCAGEQTYVATRVNVAAGLLTIDAQEVFGPTFFSGFVDTLGGLEFKYGRVEIVAKMPGTPGAAPSLFLLPVNDAYGPWPQSGEIDIVNAPDLGVSNSMVQTGLRYGLPLPEDTFTEGFYAVPPPAPDTDFVEYALEWEAGEMRWFVDGEHVMTQRQENWYSYSEDADGVFVVGADDAPFDGDFYLALAFAVAAPGGTYPQTLEIEEVRVYECANALDPLLGTGCSTGTGVSAEVAPGTPYIAPPLDIYDDAPVTLDFIEPDGNPVMGTLVAETATIGGGVTVNSNLAAADGANTVWNVDISAPSGGTGGVFMRAPDAGGFFDLTGSGTAGELLFMMRVTDENPGTTQLFAGFESGGGGSGRKELTYTADGVWRQYSVKISDLVADSGMSLDLGDIINPFYLEVVNGDATLDLDDIQVVSTCRDDGACEATPRLLAEPVPIYGPQDFETIMVAQGESIGDGWKYFVNVFESGGYLFGYPGDAPNGPQISAIATGEGGATQGVQQLSVYSDYDCCPGGGPGGGPSGHQSANGLVETNVFQEPRGVGATAISADDVGDTWTFSFDAKRGNIAVGAEHVAFFKVLDPGNGFSQTAFVTEDMTMTTTDWTRYSIEITIGDWVGQLLQFGFQTNASNYTDSGVFYDNIEVTSTP